MLRADELALLCASYSCAQPLGGVTLGSCGGAQQHGGQSWIANQMLNFLVRWARESDSAMVRVLSRSEIEWLASPLWPTVGLVAEESA